MDYSTIHSYMGSSFHWALYGFTQGQAAHVIKAQAYTPGGNRRLSMRGCSVLMFLVSPSGARPPLEGPHGSSEFLM